MPKMRSHTGAKKRFRVTGGGKLKRGQQGKNHILTKKRRKTVRNLRQTAYVSQTQASTIKKMIQG
ncbi:MAG: 50S ribosomal protein L35 [Clostridiales bacterium]|jgi:large subunit ribosomal protein L35|nr:50S ribosomal protein L35 [Clostridiales bacterium]